LRKFDAVPGVRYAASNSGKKANNPQIRERRVQGGNAAESVQKLAGTKDLQAAAAFKSVRKWDNLSLRADCWPVQVIAGREDY